VELADAGAVLEVLLVVLAVGQRDEVRLLGLFQGVDGLWRPTDDFDRLVVLREVLVEPVADLLGVFLEQRPEGFEALLVLGAEVDVLFAPIVRV